MSNERGTPKNGLLLPQYCPLSTGVHHGRSEAAWLLPADPSACPSALLPNSLIDLRTPTTFGDDQSKSHDMVGVLAPSLFP
jgi:hypothetical protein